MLEYLILVKHAVVVISCDLSLGAMWSKFLIQINVSRFALHKPILDQTNYQLQHNYAA